MNSTSKTSATKERGMVIPSTMQLEFSLVVHHTIKNQSELKNHVANCFGPIVDWIPHTGQQDTKPNLREPALRICVKTDYRPPRAFTYQQTYNIYATRISEFQKRIEFYAHVKERPWIELHTNEAFPLVRTPSHENVNVWGCAFGTLVWFSVFAPAIVFPSPMTGYFYHDTKCFELVINNKNYKLKVLYSSIRKVVVHDGGNTSEIFFLLVHPPMIFQLKGSKALRVQTIVDVPTSTIGRSNTLKIVLPKTETAKEIISRLYFRCGKTPVAYTHMTTTPVVNLPAMPHVDLDVFKCTFMLTALLWRTRALELQLPGDKLANFVQNLSNCAKRDPQMLYQVLVDVVSFCDEGVCLNFVEAIDRLLRWYERNDATLCDTMYITPANTRSVLRATITPTRCILHPATLIFNNRVLRKFDPDYALRVVFRDDDDKRLNVKSAGADDHFFRMAIQAPLHEMIHIGPRKYEFLGWSNSQIREHGVWVYARDSKGETASSIRDWMGSFGHIQSVPKFMSRMGQCFSQTQESVTVPMSEGRCRIEEDVCGGLNPENNLPYCFTDGVGKISPNLLEEVCMALDLEGEVRPSAVQFRYGGCKGMLVLDPTLEEVDIVFRKSQYKFHCPISQSLEICKVSGPLAVNLNRPLISILDHQGVDTGVFLKLQENMLKSVTDILIDSEEARNYLAFRCPLYRLNYHTLANVGVELNWEPFFRTMLLALHRKAVESIKCKARLEIPPESGRNMFGVVDETATLEYGQVFVKYSVDVSKQMTTANTKVLEGTVLVTKNPCLQKGDVRKFTAVDVPALHHIVDCIVFPQKGPRPHPSEMAGSDLDGDEYTVIWYESLFFPGENAAASHFPIASEMVNKGPIEETHMLEFLCQFIRNDQVGVLSNTHLARNDSLGLDSPVCSSLARKCSIAVDFCKSGKHVQIEKEERTHTYPDFMQKEWTKQSYRSRRALGKIFRVCRDFQESSNLERLSYENVKVDPDFLYPGWEQYKQQASDTRLHYNRLLDLILINNGLYHEAEATAQANVKLQECRDRKEVEEMVAQSLKTLWIKMTNEYMEEFKDVADLALVTEGMMRKASAWYYVAYSDPNPVHLSFPWILSQKLETIKAKHVFRPDAISRKHRILNTFNSKMQQMLDLCLNQVAPFTEEMEEEFSSQLWPKALKQAAEVILHWSHHHGLILNEDPIYFSNDEEDLLAVKEEKQMDSSNLVKSFLTLVAALKSSTYPIEYIFKYLQTCIAMRFQIPNEASSYDPCLLSKLKLLGRKAMYTYHSLAVSGHLSSLGLTLDTEAAQEEDQELEPILLSKALVTKHQGDNFATLKNYLGKVSGGSHVHVRKQGQSVLVSATGKTTSLKAIRDLLTKHHDSLIGLALDVDLIVVRK